MLGADEALGHGVVEEGDERGEVARDVEQRARLRVQPELRPRAAVSVISSTVPSPPGSERNPSASPAIIALRSCMDSTRCRRVSPSCLTSFRARWRGRTPSDFAAAREDRVRDDPHEPDAASAVDERPAPACDLLSRRCARPRRTRGGCLGRSAEDADASHGTGTLGVSKPGLFMKASRRSRSRVNVVDRGISTLLVSRRSVRPSDASEREARGAKWVSQLRPMSDEQRSDRAREPAGRVVSMNSPG